MGAGNSKSWQERLAKQTRLTSRGANNCKMTSDSVGHSWQSATKHVTYTLLIVGTRIITKRKRTQILTKSATKHMTLMLLIVGP